MQYTCLASTTNYVISTEKYYSETHYYTTMMDIFQSPFYRINKTLLFYLGQWPLQTPKERLFFRLTTILFVGSILTPKLIKFVECFGDPAGLLRCLPGLCVHAASVVKYYNCSLKSKEMKMLIDRIIQIHKERVSVLGNTIFMRYAERGRTFTIAYFAYMFMALSSYLSLPLMTTILDIVLPLNQSRERIYIYETEYFVDQDQNYVYINLHACLAMPFSVGILIANDTMIAVHVQHVCGAFAALGERLESVGDSCDDEKVQVDSTMCKDKAYEGIVTCINIHKETLEYAELIESSSSLAFLFVIGINMVGITMTGFMTVTNLDNPPEALRHGAFAFAAISTLFYTCYLGNEMMEHSKSIFVNAYNASWYDISPRAKKLLIMIMIRSAEPCKLTAGKVFVFTMENFTTALKTSMSYFTVLLSMQ